MSKNYVSCCVALVAVNLGVCAVVGFSVWFLESGWPLLGLLLLGGRCSNE